MAKFVIEKLNYITTGRNRMFLNVDRRLQKFPEPVTVLAKREEDDTIIKLEDKDELLALDDYRSSEEYKKWSEYYRKNNTTPNVTFDIEIN